MANSKNDFNWKAAEADVEERGGDLDMLSRRNAKNRDSYLRELELNPERYQSKSSTSKSSNGSDGEGCYIATCVYGSYDCPEVLALRRYRDTVLKQSKAGRLFVKVYYSVSPNLVRHFGDQRWFHLFWRDFLDRLITRV